MKNYQGNEVKFIKYYNIIVENNEKFIEIYYSDNSIIKEKYTRKTELAILKDMKNQVIVAEIWEKSKYKFRNMVSAFALVGGIVSLKNSNSVVAGSLSSLVIAISGVSIIANLDKLLDLKKHELFIENEDKINYYLLHNEEIMDNTSEELRSMVLYAKCQNIDMSSENKIIDESIKPLTINSVHKCRLSDIRKLLKNIKKIENKNNKRIALSLRYDKE